MRTEFGKGGPILAAKIGPGGPFLAADRFFRYRLTKGDLSMETEGFLLAAQDQALRTKALQNVFSPSFSSQCRLCNSQEETVEHLVFGCT